MKLLLVLMISLFSFGANAKYKAPEGSFNSFKNEADYVANRNIRELNKDGVDGLTLQEFKSRKITRDEEKAIRKQKKEGKYISPDEQFKKMDADEDGVLSEEEMGKYLSENKYDNRRKTLDQERKIKKEMRKGTYVAPSKRYEVKGLEPEIQRIDTSPQESPETSVY